MSRNALLTVGVVTILVGFLVFIIIITSFANRAPATDTSQLTQDAFFESPFGIDNRSFLVGTAGYIPANYPDSNATDIKEFWQDVEATGELHGVHTVWNDTNILPVTAASVDNQLVVILGFQTPTEWEESSDELLIVAKDILSKYRQVKYLGIGNEVNLLKAEYPQDFSKFKDAYTQTYTELKALFPDVKIFTTFQLEHLLGEGYLMGDADARLPDMEMLSQFNEYIDLAVFTAYPYFDYVSPEAIPDNYFSQLRDFTNKPVAISETGWMARSNFPLGYSGIAGHAGSLDEQTLYLHKLVDLLKHEKVEFVNWLFVNDISDWQTGAVDANLYLFDSLGLKYHDGSAKPVWDLWLDLVQVPVN